MNRDALPPYGCVHVVTDSGTDCTLFHGDIIGRLWSADLMLSDPRISEFHAMVSSRNGQLWLLPLRGCIRVGGVDVDRHPLATGDRIELGEGGVMEVTRVVPPSSALRVRADGLDATLCTGVVSVFGGASPRIVAGWHVDAPCRLWPDGLSWRRSTPDGPVLICGPSEWTVDGVRFHALVVSAPGTSFTDESHYSSASLRIVARFDSVHLHPSNGDVPCVIAGRSARLLSEIVAAQSPVHWRDIARFLWPDMEDSELRRRWDVELARLRRTFRDAGVRADLVAADGRGQVSLNLGPHDEVVDET